VLEPAALRPDAAAVLRPYQAEAVRWLGHLARWGLGGILADEMGLGKTVMALVHFFGREGAAAAVAEGSRKAPILVVCPSSLIFNWLDECRRFFPGVEAVGLYGEAPAAREALIEKGCDLLITSYALLRRDREALEARELSAVVLDEAQHIKNASSQTAQAAFALRAAERWVLTGTPVENRLTDIWSLFHFLLPQLLGGEEPFREEFADPISRGEEEPLAKLRARVRPFLLRRTKAQVLPDLPPRIEQVERAPMTGFQRGLYEAELLRARTDLEGADPSRARLQLLQALTRLRQVACHPRLLLEEEEIAKLGEEAGEATGGKFELLGELLDECIEEGHRVLLYSQWTSMLDLIEERLEERGVVRCRLDGSTRDREGEVRRFAREASIPVFLISLKAGGFGLNLTQADTVILYDPWWNPAAEDQAAARAHRMGQTLPVHVHKLITAGTVEEKVLDLQARKRDLAGRIIRSEEEALAALTAEDLRKVLFED
jgi:SNF2 family DNA or RNA helicase